MVSCRLCSGRPPDVECSNGQLWALHPTRGARRSKETVMARGKQNLQLKKRRWAKKLLREKGVEFEGTTRGLGRALISAGLVPEGVRPSKALAHVYTINQQVTPKGLLPVSVVSSFYETPEWQRLARKTKRDLGRRCMKCGTTGTHDNRIVSDHILSVRSHWHLRLDESNIQILCDRCNRAKGSLSTADYRREWEAA